MIITIMQTEVVIEVMTVIIILFYSIVFCSILIILSVIVIERNCSSCRYV
jgi:hypothetical protein